MKNWIKRNFKTIIYVSFVVPIIIAATVSISHVTSWYGITNPMSWAVYLSIGIEIAALSALAAISADMGNKVYFPFIVVTFIQFIGNIFFSFQYIEITSLTFKTWVELTGPLFENFGVDLTDLMGHKRILAVLSGGLLPVISLSFLHMLVKFTEKDRNSKTDDVVKKDLRYSDDDLKYTPKDDELEMIEKIISKKSPFVSPGISVREPNTEIFPNTTEPLEEPIVEEPIVEEPIIEEPVDVNKYNEVLHNLVGENNELISDNNINDRFITKDIDEKKKE
jgi:hypothetical protein